MFTFPALHYDCSCELELHECTVRWLPPHFQCFHRTASDAHSSMLSRCSGHSHCTTLIMTCPVRVTNFLSLLYFSVSFPVSSKVVSYYIINYFIVFINSWSSYAHVYNALYPACHLHFVIGVTCLIWNITVNWVTSLKSLGTTVINQLGLAYSPYSRLGLGCNTKANFNLDSKVG